MCLILTLFNTVFSVLMLIVIYGVYKAVDVKSKIDKGQSVNNKGIGHMFYAMAVKYGLLKVKPIPTEPEGEDTGEEGEDYGDDTELYMAIDELKDRIDLIETLMVSIQQELISIRNKIGD